MPFLNEDGLQTFWDISKRFFAKKLGITPTSEKVTIALKDATTDENQIASGDIPAATTSAAGAMTAADKTKLDGVAEGATANVGTITGVTVNSPISGGGTSGNVTVSHATSGVTAKTYGALATTALTPGFGDTFDVPGIKVNATGHVESAGSHTVKIPTTEASESASGLMSKTDKKKLNGVAEGATANTGTIEGITSTGPIVGTGTSGTVALSHANSGVSAGSYGDTATTALTPGFGDTVNVPGVVVNATGHVTEAGTHTVKIPDTEADADASGLMTSAQFTKLNGIETGATKNSASTAAPGNVAASSVQGTSLNYARQDHTHGITVATGDSNGQVKIAGQNASVKGLGSAAYTQSSAYATAAQGTLADTAIPASEKGANSGVATLGTDGKVPTSQLPTIPSANTTATNIKMDGTQSAGSLDTFAKADHVHPTDTSRAPLANPEFTGTPKAPTAANGTSTTQIATTAFVMNAFQANDAMIFKGTIGTGGTVTSLPATHYQGWTYKVITAGTYAGQSCEIGDMIICITDGTSANNAHWTVVQSNIDGAVTGPSSSTAAHVATFSGTTGKVIQDSGFTIGSNVPADAKFTDTVYTHPTKTAASAAAVKVGNDSEGHVVLGSALTASDIGAATSSHAHGNITSGGDITASAPTIASGDKIIINDESASKITNGPSFGASTTTYLRNDGSWGTPAGTYSLPDANASTKGGVTLSDATDGTDAAASGVKAATPKAVSDALAAAKSYTDTAVGGVDTGVTGVKGNAETTYRTGQVNLTPANIGAASSSHTHASYVNQNAFSNVKIGSTTVAADSTTDTLELEAGSNITLTPDATNDKVTIAATNDDTKNTAGSTDSSSKLFIIGATSQAANPQTYSQDTAYVGTDGHLYSNSNQVVNLSDTQALTNKTYEGYTLADAAEKSVDSSIAAASTSTNLPTSAAVAAFVEGKGYKTTDNDTKTSWYGTSSTAAGTAAKAVTCSGYALTAGNFVAVLFTTANTAAAPTLNINSTGAKNVYVGSAIASATNPCKWSANTVVYFIYDGSYYRYLGQMKDFGNSWYGTCGTTAGTAAKVITCANFQPVVGAVIAIQCTTANTVTSGAITLNVNSTDQKTVYYKNAATSASNTLPWAIGDIMTFVYDGNYFRYVSSTAGGSIEAISNSTIDTICV